MVIIEIVAVRRPFQMSVDRTLKFRQLSVVIDAVAVSVYCINELTHIIQTLHQPSA